MAKHPDLMLSSQALQSAPLAMLMLDGSGRVTWANDELACILGVPIESLIGNGDDKLVQMCLKRLLSDDEIIALPSINNNPECWLKCWIQDMPEQSGKGQLRYFADVSEYIRTKDPVTGLLNERSLVQGLDPQVSRSRRYNNPLSVVAMYLEGLEDMDDRYGVSTRERVLVTVGQLLKDQMRWADLIAHTEEDEFIFVLPETRKDDASKLVAKVNEYLLKMDVVADNGDPIELIPHFGVAEWQKGDDVTLLLSRVSEALKAGHGAEVIQMN
ncbi:MAG: GGDEF domain-containing protein [Gammaproteobacteria bacterium]|nr:GGDEF domain-containing protein [Gammaproteobacteria bacterium]MDH5613703.1 GGDEF domain-containing protein [Gammaproteobacteria bacterium]